jgi:hypothetical protein
MDTNERLREVEDRFHRLAVMAAQYNQDDCETCGNKDVDTCTNCKELVVLSNWKPVAK